MNKNNINIVYANTIDYGYDLKQRPQHLMELLAKRGYQIHWLNINHQENKMRERIHENMWVYFNKEVFFKRYINPDIYFSSWSNRWIDLDTIKPKLGVIYDSLDNFVENSYQESDMIKRADIVMTTSKLLYELRKQEHPDVVMCENACFPELGKFEYDIPKDIEEYKEQGVPIILFSGALATWCDIDLLEFIADKYKLFMVGKKFNVSKIPDNFVYLGNKSYEQLQAYYHYCDITLLPFRRCQTSDYSDPIKIYESLAHGKIVVATNIPETKKYNKNIVISSASRREFVDNIKRALHQSKNEVLKNLCYETAKNNSWEHRIDIIEEQIKKLWIKKNGGI
jgi:glycosyltransferase involved in cell wall biosynthesis